MTGGIEDLMRHAQKVQKDVARVSESLKNRVVEGKASGGRVVCAINGAREVVSIRIQKDAVDPDDLTLLEDLVIAAVNAALKKAEEMISKEMGKVTGGLNIPGLT